MVWDSRPFLPARADGAKDSDQGDWFDPIKDPTMVRPGEHAAETSPTGDAAAAFRAAIRLKPDDAEAHYDLGVALGRQGRLYEAVAAFRAAIRLKPALAEAHYGLGSALYAQRKLDESVAAYREAVRLVPSDAMVQDGLAAALDLQGKPDERLQTTRPRRSGSRPDVLAWSRHATGVALGWQGRLEEAAVAFREAIGQKPDLAEAHGNLGLALAAMGRLEADLAEAHGNLDLALAALGKLEEAAVNSVRYRSTSPATPFRARPYRTLGQTLGAQGGSTTLSPSTARRSDSIRLGPAFRDLGDALNRQEKSDEAAATSARQPG